MNHPWLESVRKSLIERHLPKPYVNRVISELNDHIEDLSSELTSSSNIAEVIEKNMGSQRLIVETIIENYGSSFHFSQFHIKNLMTIALPLFFLTWLFDGVVHTTFLKELYLQSSPLWVMDGNGVLQSQFFTRHVCWILFAQLSKSFIFLHHFFKDFFEEIISKCG